MDRAKVNTSYVIFIRDRRYHDYLAEDHTFYSLTYAMFAILEKAREIDLPVRLGYDADTAVESGRHEGRLEILQEAIQHKIVETSISETHRWLSGSDVTLKQQGINFPYAINMFSFLGTLDFAITQCQFILDMADPGVKNGRVLNDIKMGGLIKHAPDFNYCDWLRAMNSWRDALLAAYAKC